MTQSLVHRLQHLGFKVTIEAETVAA
jgi:hypothetical protein